MDEGSKFRVWNAKLCDNSEMISTADEILETYVKLPAMEKKRVASVILREYITVDIPPATDDELVLAAEDIFLELDRCEAEDA